MALKKTKFDKLAKITLREEMVYTHDYWFWCDEEDDWWDYDDNWWDNIKYEYLPDVGYYPWIKKIDMMSIYPKEILRDKKLEELFKELDNERRRKDL